MNAHTQRSAKEVYMYRGTDIRMRTQRTFDLGESWEQRLCTTEIRVVGIGTLLLLALMLCACGSKTSLRITADQLTREFQVDNARSTARYKGRTLVVTGPATVIDRMPAECQCISMLLDDPRELGALTRQVMCFFPEYRLKDRAMQLVDNQTITVQGKCTGTLTPLAPLVSLEDCTLLD